VDAAALLRRIAEVRAGTAPQPEAPRWASWLTRVAAMTTPPPQTVDEVDRRERAFTQLCLAVPEAGDFSRTFLERVRAGAQETLRLCRWLQQMLAAPQEALAPEAEEARAWALSVLDGPEGLAAKERLLADAASAWRTYEQQRALVLMNHRPRLGQVHRLDLNAEQERLVLLEPDGRRRINALAGTGKSVVLLHRALRLLVQRPGSSVLLVTPTDALAEDLAAAVEGFLPGEALRKPIAIRSLRSVLDDWWAPRHVRVLDTEGAQHSWRVFVNDADFSEGHALQTPQARTLLRYLGQHLPARPTGEPRYVDARHKTYCEHQRALDYLRDEFAWLTSGMLPSEYATYGSRPGQRTLARKGRRIPLEAEEREVVLGLLRAWHAWLDGRSEVDDGLAAGRMLEAVLASSGEAVRFRAHHAVDHLLVDEEQVFGTCEWGVLAHLVRDLKEEACLLAAGDREQQGRIKRCVPSDIRLPHGVRGLAFGGGLTLHLRQQYRLTQQVADAGQRLVDAFGDADRESGEGGQEAFGACREGLLPLLLRTDAQETDVAALLAQMEAGREVALITARESEEDLQLCERIAQRAGRTPYREGRPAEGAKATRVAVSGISTMAGREFDVVFLVSFSALPSPSAPQAEWGRQAADAYMAMTRARDVVVLCCPGPSAFVECLEAAPSRVLTLRPLSDSPEALPAAAAYLRRGGSP
jgi:hypothetical protein